MRNDDRLSREELRQFLLRVLNCVADDLGLPKQEAPNEEGERKDEEAEQIH